MPGLHDLRNYRRGAEWALAAGVSLELGIIAALSERSADASDIADTLDLSVRGVEALLRPLGELGAVTRDDTGWRLTGAGRARFVDRDHPDFEADNLLHWMRSIRRWSHDLPEVVRSGKPGRDDRPASGPKHGKDLEEFMAAMANRAPDDVAAVADAVREAAPRATTLLDVGGGPGVYARALADRGFEVTLLDRQEVIRLVSDAYGLRSDSRIHLVSADFLEELPDREYEVVLLANVSHIYGPSTNRDLIRRVAAKLTPGGCVAIVDFVRGMSEFATLFALTMLLSTDDGGTWSLPEYSNWLLGAGLERVRCTTVLPDVQLITAARPVARRVPG